jgi:2-polyprenyl-6-methoxyphenol hydroxylase-like FAD-dependent oxidoreductase
MTHTRTARVIGGGIAGPAAAIALQKVGIDPVVYEAHPTGADGIGVFLTLASNGVDALRALDVDRPALAAGFSTPAITLRSHTGKRPLRQRARSAAGALVIGIRPPAWPVVLKNSLRTGARGFILML